MGLTSTEDKDAIVLVELQEMLKDTATGITQIQPDPENWSDWIVYLLKTLGEKTREEQAFEETLDRLNNSLESRLETGSW